MLPTLYKAIATELQTMKQAMSSAPTEPSNQLELE